jgi:hypothetical protein
MKPTSPLVRAPIASATRRLREQGMPPEEVEAVLDVDEAQVLRRYMELHRERLDERLAAERRALEGVERSLALAILQRTGQAASGEARHAARRKEVHMTEHDVQGSTRQPKTGPVSRTCRLLMAGGMAFVAIDWASAGITDFSRPKTLTNPWLWILIGLGIYYVLYQTAASGFGRRWGIRTVVAFGIVLIGAGAAALATEGELWAAPLTWMLFGLVLGLLILTAIGALISLALGTPGCEFGALGELIRRLRGVPEPEGADAMWCVLGMHRLDEWEARRSMDRDGAESTTESSPRA